MRVQMIPDEGIFGHIHEELSETAIREERRRETLFGIALELLVNNRHKLKWFKLYCSQLSSSTLLKTGHGRAGLTFFFGLYRVIPLLMLLSAYLRRNNQARAIRPRRQICIQRMKSFDEISNFNHSHGAPLTRSPTSPAPSLSPRRRTHSWAPSSFWPPLGRSQEGRLSSDSFSVNSSPVPHRGFEVTTRPSRNRQPQKSWHNVHQSDTSNSHTPTSLGDVDWMQRWRSLSAVVRLIHLTVK